MRGLAVLGMEVLFAAMLAGCIFSTREPEDPGTDDQVEWQTPIEPRLVLANIVATMEAKSTTNYQRSLDDSFTFIPDPADASLVGDHFDGWDKTRELARFGDILSSEGELTFSWTPTGEPLTASEDEVYYEDLAYVVEFRRGEGDAASDTTFSGRSDLYLKEGANGLYTVSKWVDKRDESGRSSSGMLRYYGTPWPGSGRPRGLGAAAPLVVPGGAPRGRAAYEPPDIGS